MLNNIYSINNPPKNTPSALHNLNSKYQKVCYSNRFSFDYCFFTFAFLFLRYFMFAFITDLTTKNKSSRYTLKYDWQNSQMTRDTIKKSVIKIASLFVASIIVSSPTLANANSNTNSRSNIHNNGNTIIRNKPCKLPKSYYKNVSCTSDSRYFLAVKDSGEPVALLNKSGKKSADLTKYQRVMPQRMQDGLIPVMNNGKVGYINGKGVVAIPTMYDPLTGANWARGFSNSRVVVKKKGKWGVINTANKTIVPFSSRIENISDFYHKKAKMVKAGKLYAISTNGRLVLVANSNVTKNSLVENVSTKRIATKNNSVKKSKNTQKKKASKRTKAHKTVKSNKSIRTNKTIAKTRILGKKIGKKATKAHTNKRTGKKIGNTIHVPSKHKRPVQKKVRKASTEVNLSDDKIIELLQQYDVLAPDSRLFNGDKEVIINKAQPKKSPKQPLKQRPTQVPKQALTSESLTKKLAKQPSKQLSQQLPKPVSEQLLKQQLLNRLPKSDKRVIASLKYNTLNDSRKMFPHLKNGKWGFVSVRGVNMIAYSFDEVTPFSNGLAGVRMADNWGFINKAGDLVIDFRFNKQNVMKDGENYHGMSPFTFVEGKAWVSNSSDGGKLCVDINGANTEC